MKRLFFAAESRRDVRVLSRLPVRPDVLVSAGRFWTGKKLRRANALKEALAEKAGTILIDSGAQQFSHKFLQYPYDSRTYAEWADWMGGDWIASLDVPLDILEWKGMDYDPEEVLEVTVDNAVDLFELWEDGVMRAKPLLVIQGLKDEWFDTCVNMYAERGLLRRYSFWALGSLCMSLFARRRKIRRVTAMVRRRLGQSAWVHIFGPDMDSWEAIVGLVDSIDTSMWRMPKDRSFYPTALASCIVDGRRVGIRSAKRAKSRAKFVEGDTIIDWEGWCAMQALEIWRKFEGLRRSSEAQRVLTDFYAEQHKLTEWL